MGDMSDTTEVRPGQVWADSDPRSTGWTLRVDAIDGDKAVCTILINPDSPGIYWQQWDARGWQTRIPLSQFRPTSTGYRLVGEGI